MDRTEGEALEAIADYLGQPLKVVRGHARLREDLGLAEGFGAEMELELHLEERLGLIQDLDLSQCETVRDVVEVALEGTP